MRKHFFHYVQVIALLKMHAINSRSEFTSMSNRHESHSDAVSREFLAGNQFQAYFRSETALYPLLRITHESPPPTGGLELFLNTDCRT